MRVFITGATGWIGSALVPELLAAGHDVVGLVRSDSSAAALAAAGGEPLRGEIADLDVLYEGAAGSDGVVHLAFDHDFSKIEQTIRADLAAIETFGKALDGTDKPFVIASATAGLPVGRVGTEADDIDPHGIGAPRIAGTDLALAFADRGVRSSVVRFAPTVHGKGDHGFIASLVDIARTTGVSGYVGDGAGRWPAVHVLDAARLIRLAVQRAPAGSVLHAVADEGVPVRTIADVIGKHLDVPVARIADEDATARFGFLAMLLAMDVPATSTRTRELMGWQPTHPGLVADLDEGHYFAGQ